MSTMIYEIYDALRSVGVAEEKAKAAAEAMTAQVASKQDLNEFALRLEAKMSDMETRIIKWNVGTIIATAGLVLAILKLTT